jgi:4-amino-4-deoxy-L-arabinose transferase-like glycosyltransferase
MDLLRKQGRTSAICVGLIAFLAIFLKFYEPGLGFSSSTYGALAHNILKTGSWFHPRLGPQLFDPFVDHPYLVIWLDALVFALFGASAQTIRLVSSVAGVAVVMAVFLITRRRINERAALFATLGLLFVNEFMHFASSGWLDMPMIALAWMGWLVLEKSQKSPRLLDSFGGGCLLGLSFLAKGVSALAIGPIFIFAIVQSRDQKKRCAAIFSGLIFPVVVFTALHFHSQHFIFWKPYFFRQLVAQNQMQRQITSLRDFLWYVGDILRYGHIVTLIGLAGVYKMFRTGRRDLALLIAAELALHIAAYSLSSRHYGQYVIPVFPWLAISSGFYLQNFWKNVQPEQLAKAALVTAVVGFVVLDLLPIRVHSGTDHPFLGFSTSLDQLKDDGVMYFYGRVEDQPTWEDMASDIPWYWHREPRIADVDTILTKLRLEDPKALGIMPYDLYQHEVARRLPSTATLRLCMWNETYAIIADQRLCPEDFIGYRPLSGSQGRGAW